jgi:hypothetical protein|tara:strand:- start:398 stop:670 length:273 start_codon:yes stop_codon:yes gene_type:complete
VEQELLQEQQREEHQELIQLFYVKHPQVVAVVVQLEQVFNLELLVDQEVVDLVADLIQEDLELHVKVIMAEQVLVVDLTTELVVVVEQEL